MKTTAFRNVLAAPSLLAIGASLALAACGADAPDAEETVPAAEEAPAAEIATAEIKDTEGNVVGTAMITGEDGALRVNVDVEGLPPGPHGAHIHAVGDCSAPDFSSAGGHWNPGDTNHGTNSEPPNPHAGDIGNLEIGESGAGSLTNTSDGTWAGLFDEDGSAFVIHADADDMESQPSGNAGARLACGIFVRS